ncbi:hypothetical protein L2E82_51615 [Cichorium intybus]|nr:hypothetical protein L2E82_51615 [Cichorium intybus]
METETARRRVGTLCHPLDIEVCPTDGVIQSEFKDTNTGKISDGGRFISGFGAGVIEALLIGVEWFAFEKKKNKVKGQRLVFNSMDITEIVSQFLQSHSERVTEPKSTDLLTE